MLRCFPPKEKKKKIKGEGKRRCEKEEMEEKGEGEKTYHNPVVVFAACEPENF